MTAHEGTLTAGRNLSFRGFKKTSVRSTDGLALNVHQNEGVESTLWWRLFCAKYGSILCTQVLELRLSKLIIFYSNMFALYLSILL